MAASGQEVLWNWRYFSWIAFLGKPTYAINVYIENRTITFPYIQDHYQNILIFLRKLNLFLFIDRWPQPRFGAFPRCSLGRSPKPKPKDTNQQFWPPGPTSRRRLQLLPLRRFPNKCPFHRKCQVDHLRMAPGNFRRPNGSLQRSCCDWQRIV